MNREILFIAQQVKEVHEGEPWFGRSVKDILNEIGEDIVFEKHRGQHSILELLWHMITWKEFTVGCLRNNKNESLQNFEKNDWRVLNHSQKSLWKEGLMRFEQVQNELVETILQQEDDILSQKIDGKNYDFRKLLNGIREHDIYHLGQIAYIKNMLQK